MPKILNINKDELFDLYVNKEHTIEEICAILNVKSSITIAKYMRKYNIPSRDVNSLRQQETFGGRTYEAFGEYLKNLYQVQHKSINQISKIIGVSTRIVKKYLDEFGIQTFAHKEANKIFNSGERCNNWKGGKTILNGYIAILKPEHPHTIGGGYVYEHRLIMEKHLKRYLRPEEIVHHINGIKTDNRLENLEILSNSQHRKKHFDEFSNELGTNNYLNSYK
jgi:hypothetical protein